VKPERTNEICLQWVAANGQTEVLSALLKSPEIAVNIDGRDEAGNTALYLAAFARSPESVRVLLTHGADIHVRSNDIHKGWGYLKTQNSTHGFTPLHGWANSNDRSLRDRPRTSLEDLEKTLVLLLEAGCDIDAKDDKGRTPLFAWNNQGTFRRGDQAQAAPFVSLLLNYGADPRVVDRNGNKPLHKVHRRRRREEVVKLLIDAGVNMNAANHDGSTPLIESAKSRCLHVRYLIDHGADVSMYTRLGWKYSSASRMRIVVAGT
jgi:ankyrin repeat protein